jgi:hypothetical protein
MLSTDQKGKRAFQMLTRFQRIGRWLSEMNWALYSCWIDQMFGSVQFVVPIGQCPLTPRKWLQISSLPWLSLMCQETEWVMDNGTVHFLQLSQDDDSAQSTEFYLSAFKSWVHSSRHGEYLFLCWAGYFITAESTGHVRSWHSSLDNYKMPSLSVLQIHVWC